MRVDANQLTVECVVDFGEIEAEWLALEERGLTSVYQRYHWTSAWHRHVGRITGTEPVIVVGRVLGELVFLWPMGIRNFGPLRVGHWLGGNHANYNFGIYNPDFLPALSKRHMVRCLETAAQAHQVDIFALHNQPRVWRGGDNPFIQLPSQASPSNAMSVALRSPYDEYLQSVRSSSSRRKLRRKERRYRQAGDCRFVRAESPGQIADIMTAFAEQKAVQFSDRGIHNVFAEPGVHDFFVDLAVMSLDLADPCVEIHALYLDDKIRAIWAGGYASGRFSGMFNSIAMDDRLTLSPGTVLLSALVEQCCDRGVVEFDLGVGDAAYKSDWCDTVDELFDTIYPVTAAGRVATPAIRSFLAVKRFAKSQPMIRDGYRGARRALGIR